MVNGTIVGNAFKKKTTILKYNTLQYYILYSCKGGRVNETNLSELVQVESIIKTQSCKLITIKQYKFKSFKVNMKKCISF